MGLVLIRILTNIMIFNQRVEKLAKIICNKGVVYGKDCFIQDEKSIFANNHYIEVLHEIAHWIACEPQYRQLDNLGLPHDSEKGHIFYNRMMYEESMAFVITKLLFDVYFKDDTDEHSKKYIAYVDNLCEELCKLEKLSPMAQRKIANRIFTNYNNIDIDKDN